MAQPPPAEEAGQDVPDHPGLTISHLDKGITEEVHHDNNTAAREEATKELPNEGILSLTYRLLQIILSSRFLMSYYGGDERPL